MIHICKVGRETHMDTKRLEGIDTALLAWFDENARVLPWRENPKPYYVWVSEIMLQQTRVEAVKPFFARFIAALPDVAALAACPIGAASQIVGGAWLL